jgi:hypothetical protein
MRIFLLLWSLLSGFAGIGQGSGERPVSGERWFGADDPHIRYMGRIDFSNPKLPRFWAPGVNMCIRYRGARCRIIVHDQVPDDRTHNYIVMLEDYSGVYRFKLHGPTDTLTILGNGRAWMGDSELKNLERSNRQDREPDPNADHLITLCKATEGIAWMELAGVLADSLLPLDALSDRKIEFIGNSITCGAGSDSYEIPCGQGEWYDQNDALGSYGALTARGLDAEWHLTSVSGIGLIHSCCKMTITMPEVFDRMDVRGNQGDWDFSRYQPDVVTVCLGQNDGIQDSTLFCGAYVRFLGHLRHVYPRARLVLLTSPMGNAQLTTVLKRYIGGVVEAVQKAGDERVSSYFFSRQWSKGCGGHPDMQEHFEIATELKIYLRQLMDW